MTTFTVQLTAAVRCACGRVYNLSGLQVVEADDVVSVVHEIEACPECIGDDGPGGGEEQAAE